METASEGHEETAEAKLLSATSCQQPLSPLSGQSPVPSTQLKLMPRTTTQISIWRVGVPPVAPVHQPGILLSCSVVPTDTKQAPQTSTTLTDELGAFSPAFAPSLSLLSGRLFSLRHRQTHHWGRGRGVGSWGLRGPAQGINPRVNSAPGGGG